MLRRLLLILMLLSALPAHAEVPRIAAAADLRQALGLIAAAFTRDTGERVELTFGASGALSRQLQQGAPFTLFLSADEDYALRLADAGLTVDRGQLYAIGRLALVTRKGSGIPVDPQLRSLRVALPAGRIRHLAIANPAFAPYGQRAEQVLTGAGLLPTFRDRLVRGENVAQALQFVLSGAAEAGLVSDALVHDPAVAAQLDIARLPATLHAPLRQRLVLMTGAGPVARSFAAYVTGKPGRTILAAHGFDLP